MTLKTFIMTLKTFIKSAALGAGALLLFAGFALAQTPPAAAPAASGAEKHELRRKIRHECRDKTKEMKGMERREAMHKCVSDASAAAGLEDKRQRRAKMKELHNSCRAEAKARKLEPGAKEYRGFLRECEGRH